MRNGTCLEYRTSCIQQKALCKCHAAKLHPYSADHALDDHVPAENHSERRVVASDAVGVKCKLMFLVATGLDDTYVSTTVEEYNPN